MRCVCIWAVGERVHAYALCVGSVVVVVMVEDIITKNSMEFVLVEECQPVNTILQGKRNERRLKEQ